MAEQLNGWLGCYKRFKIKKRGAEDFRASLFFFFVGWIYSLSEESETVFAWESVSHPFCSPVCSNRTSGFF